MAFLQLFLLPSARPSRCKRKGMRRRKLSSTRKNASSWKRLCALGRRKGSFEGQFQERLDIMSNFIIIYVNHHGRLLQYQKSPYSFTWISFPSQSQKHPSSTDRTAQHVRVKFRKLIDSPHKRLQECNHHRVYKAPQHDFFSYS